jgi:hypothetical protein
MNKGAVRRRTTSKVTRTDRCVGAFVPVKSPSLETCASERSTEADANSL